ncbi:hypothetical protein DFR50_102175 [Roseiarcus fermentans]|uniref:Outer membrane protein beta-barrel domain-containing protein n=1 Tax=Roseiarcus fermentans TaxID=1473586 RepID=A0A366FSM9_9HYPH|nr:hypothetical protein [Roseiarcus fermentans]RBP17683.1 hypothetical protein DFR50_102175 [Roseiarcus fermentans]
MTRLLNTTLMVCALAAAATASAAADLPTRKEPPPPVPVVQASPWRVELTGYGWATSLAGSAGFGSQPTLPYYASFGKVIEHFQGGLMGAVVARNGTYIVGLDGIWSRVGGAGTVQVSRLPGGALGTDLTLTEAFATAFGGVRIPVGPPNLELYATVGARYMFSGTKLTLSTPLNFNLNTTANKSWVNPVAGLAGQYRFDDRWFMNLLADIGGWSDSATGQALASVGYNWTKTWSTTLGYRVMYNYEKQNTGYDPITFEPRSFRYQQWMYGPFAGVKYSF